MEQSKWFGVGLVGFYWFVLTGFWGPDGHLIALGLLILALGGLLTRIRGSFKQAYFLWGVVAFGLYAVARGGIGYLSAPATLSSQLSGVLHLLRIAGMMSLLIVPYMLGRKGKTRAETAFALILVGFVINVLLLLDWQAGWEGIKSELLSRPRWRMNPNAFGAAAGILLIGTGVMGFRWLRRLQGRVSIPVQGLFSVIWLLFVLFLGESLIISQSRASWLATGLAGLVVGFLLLAAYWRLTKGRDRKKYLGFGALIALAVISLGLVQSSILEDRFTDEAKSWALLSDLRLEEIPKHSIGIRIRLWQFGVEHIGERPLLGWSPGGVSNLLTEEADPAIQKGYMHNFPLQIAMELGLIGAGLFLTLVALSAVEIQKAFREGRLPLEWAVFWWGALLFLSVEGMFDAPFHHAEYAFVILFLAALPLACHVERLCAFGHLDYGKSPE